MHSGDRDSTMSTLALSVTCYLMQVAGHFAALHARRPMTRERQGQVDFALRTLLYIAAGAGLAELVVSPITADSFLSAIFLAASVRALNEQSHIDLHRYATLPRTAKLSLHIITYAVRNESITHRRDTHIRTHHPHSVEQGDPTAADLLFTSNRYVVWFGAVIVRDLRSRLTVRSVRRAPNHQDQWLTGLALLKIVGLCVILLWVSPIAGCALMLAALLFSTGMVLSVLIEHDWTRYPFPSATTNTTLLTARETTVGIRLSRSGIIGFFAENVLFPYGDLYHWAHSCRPGRHWTDLPRLEEELCLAGFNPMRRSIVEQIRLVHARMCQVTLVGAANG